MSFKFLSMIIDLPVVVFHEIKLYIYIFVVEHMTGNLLSVLKGNLPGMFIESSSRN